MQIMIQVLQYPNKTKESMPIHMIYYDTFKTHICKQAVNYANKCHIKFLDACRLGLFHFRVATCYVCVRLYSSNEIRKIQNEYLISFVKIWWVCSFDCTALTRLLIKLKTKMLDKSRLMRLFLQNQNIIQMQYVDLSNAIIRGWFNLKNKVYIINVIQLLLMMLMEKEAICASARFLMSSGVKNTPLEVKLRIKVYHKCVRTWLFFTIFGQIYIKVERAYLTCDVIRNSLRLC